VNCAGTRAGGAPAFARDWQDDASAFRSSDDMLNRIWNCARYSSKATTSPAFNGR